MEPGGGAVNYLEEMGGSCGYVILLKEKGSDVVIRTLITTFCKSGLS